jgi:hypothetical protein
VEGTVQARVSATVRALNGASAGQPSPTRAPGATGAAVTPSVVTAAASAAASQGAATPLSSPAAAGTSTSSTPLAGTPSPPASAATAAASSGSPTVAGAATASPAATLSFGAFAHVGGFAVTVNRYEWGYTCPGSSSSAADVKPAQGAKFVGVYATAHDEGSSAIQVPTLQWTLDGYSADDLAQSPCRLETPTFAGNCPPARSLTPDALCEGWVLFEVPEAVPVAGATVRLQAAALASPALWRLPA